MDFKWAENKMKLQRAIAKANYNQTPSEQAIKELYLAMAGRINPGYEEVTSVPMAMIEEPIKTVFEIPTPEQTVEILSFGLNEVQPKKKGKKNVE